MRYLFLLVIFSSLVVCADSQTVFKTPSGARYHLSNCKTVKNVSKEISMAEAVELGLTPCKICKPINFYESDLPVENKARGESTTVQCQGRTKAGSRCKHRTSIGNGYCFQHQPE